MLGPRRSPPEGLGPWRPTFSPPKEATVGALHRYNCTVQATGGGLKLGDLRLQVTSLDGASTFGASSWRLSVRDTGGVAIGEYSWTNATTGVWVSGGGELLESPDGVDLGPVAQNLSGDRLVAMN